MKILIVTQVVDTQHPILGFFHRWIEEFAKHSEQVQVICLYEGTHSLPKNVTVYSLGKDKGLSKVQQLFRFYRYVLSKRRTYDAVFVHMNPIYLVLAGTIWRLLRKKVGLWYTHGTVSWTLRIGTIFAHKVFTASKESFKINTPKKYITGHGIDTNQFFPQEQAKTIDLITVGRISPKKNISFLLDVLAEVRKTIPVTLTIVGTVPENIAEDFYATLQKQSRELGIEQAVTWMGAITHDALPDILNRSKVFVTASQTGSLDKVVLEAMACGIPVVSAASGTNSLALGAYQVESVHQFSLKIKELFATSNFKNEEYVSYVKTSHSLESLIGKIFNQYVN